jgi:outer membrane protein OmpA-like peptidoglycan-associated protein
MRIKREEAERVRQAKAEIEAAARTASPPAKTDEKIADPGPGPVVPPTPVTPKVAVAPAVKSGQVAAASPPRQPQPQPAAPAIAPVRAKPAAVEKSGGGPPRVEFAPGTADLTPDARVELDAIAKSLGGDPNKRLQLIAFATGTNDEANQARRLSLSRALNVRAYLIDHGVRNTRMDVRALGNRPDGTKAVDRVDIVFLDQ